MVFLISVLDHVLGFLLAVVERYILPLTLASHWREDLQILRHRQGSINVMPPSLSKTSAAIRSIFITG
jgi:hypothetical protein